MAEKILKGINFPGLEDTYLIPEVDSTLSKSGSPADAKVVGEALTGKQPIGNYIKTINGNAPDENGNIEVVGGGESVAVQSDWNVTDETNAAYIKNKPFYSNFAVTPLLENATVTFQKIPVTTDSKNLYAGGMESSEDTVSLWNEGFTSATVIWDGVTYECTPFSADGMTFIGNEYILTGVDTGGEPFALGFISKAGSYSVEMYSFEMIPSDGSELAETMEHTVSVSINKYEIVKIPADYLYQPDWNTTDKTDPAYIKNKPFGEESGIIKYLDNKYISFVESTGLDFISKDDYELIWDSEVPGWTTSSPWIITLNQFEELNKLYLENKTLCVNIDGVIFNTPLTPTSSEPPYLGFSLGDPLFENYPFWILTGLNTDMPENTYTMAIFIPNTDHDTESSINKNIHIYIDGKERINPEYLYKSDWNVTDENDPAYIKNRPFGSDTITLLDVTFQDSLINDGTEWNGICIVEDTTSNTLIVGDTYTVIYCGTEYICECFSYMGVPCVGNTMLIGVASEVPFMIVRDMSGEFAGGVAGWGLMLVELPTDLTISGAYPCTIKSSGVKYLDNKYLDFMDVQEAAEILPEQTITYTLDSENTEIPEQSMFTCAYVSQNGSIEGSMDETFYTSLSNLTAGIEYTVRFDGVEYKLIARDLSALAPSTLTVNKYVGLGNLAMFNYGDDTGEPFVFLLVDVAQNGKSMLQAVSAIYHTPDIESLNHVVGIDSSYSAVIKEEYLPEGYGSSTGPSLPTVTTEDAGKFLRVTDEGIWAAVSIPNAEGVGF